MSDKPKPWEHPTWLEDPAAYYAAKELKDARMGRWLRNSLVLFVVALLLVELLAPDFRKFGLVSAGLFWAFWMMATIGIWQHYNEKPGTY